MKSTKLFIIISFLLCTVACNTSKAQPSNTIYQTFATNASLGSSTTVYGPVFPNIGQTFHQLQYDVTAKLGHTNCTGMNAAGTPAAQFIGSYVNDYTKGNILPQRIYLTGIADGLAYNFYNQATGAFPYVFILIANFDNVNCNLSVYYTGTVYPFAAPTKSTDQEVSTTYNTSGDHVALAHLTNGIVPLNLTAAIISNSDAGQVITFKCTSGGSTAPVTVYLTNGGNIVLPFTGQDYMKCFTSTDFVVNLGSSTNVGIKLQFTYGGNGN